MINIAWKKWNRLTALYPSDKKSVSGNKYWWYQCDCGNMAEQLPSNVRRKTSGVKSCGCLQKEKRHGEIWLTNLVFRARRHAEQRGVVYDLSRDEVRELAKSPCVYCGETDINGIDRVDSSKGYTPENSVSCCSTCNYMKRSHSVEDFKKQIERIYEHSVK